MNHYLLFNWVHWYNTQNAAQVHQVANFKRQITGWDKKQWDAWHHRHLANLLANLHRPTWLMNALEHLREG